MEYVTIVSAPAADNPANQYLAPYSGCAMGEWFMENGMDALIVYDDLSKHAVAYRQISLILKRPSGREAYPGDVFYLHSRLLERSARLNEESGNGSLTALPIIETQMGDVSGYIPTNVISITDGQIFLETDLFNKGIKPAVSVGLSVSRVGSAAQIKAYKKVAGKVKLELAQFRELAAFSQFESDLDASTKARLDRGARIVEMFKQGAYEPVPVEVQTAVMWGMQNDFFDSIAVEDITRSVESLKDYLSTQGKEACEEIYRSGKLEESTEQKLKSALEDWKAFFLVGLGTLLKMASSKDIRNRIKGVKSTRQITRAMQMVATSKMKKAQDSAKSGRPYALLLSDIIVSIADEFEEITSSYFNQKPVKHRGILVIGTDKGLCGALNGNLFRKLSDVENTAKFVAVGKGLPNISRVLEKDLIADFTLPDKPTFSDIRKIVDFLLRSYDQGDIDTIEVLFTSFINTLQQEPEMVKLFPLNGLDEMNEKLHSRFGELNHEVPKDDREILIEDRDLVLAELATLYLKQEVFQLILEAQASEHSARMVAMKTATDNAGNLIDDLTLQYNRARQAAITQEILEISAASFSE